MQNLKESIIQNFIKMAIEEDLGSGDLTTDSIIKVPETSTAEIIAKEALVLSGIQVFKKVFLYLDSKSKFIDQAFVDGDKVPSGSPILKIRAESGVLLKGERSALNILQRMSGIATKTRKFVDQAGPVTILDTRKTTPGLRAFEKYAVVCGGGKNHRFGLFDAVLIKDNHIKVAGSITEAVKRVLANVPENISVEVETTNMDEVREALANPVDIIMLDNMDLEQTRKAVTMIAGKVKVEVSGNMTLDRLTDLSQTGIDYVSVGALTHSVKAVDISMNFLD